MVSHGEIIVAADATVIAPKASKETSLLGKSLFQIVGEQVAQALLENGLIDDKGKPQSPLTEGTLDAVAYALAEGLNHGLTSVKFVQEPGTWVDVLEVTDLFARTMARPSIQVRDDTLHIDLTEGGERKGALLKTVAIPLPEPSSDRPFEVHFTSEIRMKPDPLKTEIIPDFPPTPQHRKLQ